MNSILSIVPTVRALLITVFVPTALAAGSDHAPPESAAPGLTVVAQGLTNPRHMRFGPDGLLCVAKAGTGRDHLADTPGCPTAENMSTTPPLHRYMAGFFGGISRVVANGSRLVMASKLNFPVGLVESPGTDALIGSLAGYRQGTVEDQGGIVRVNFGEPPVITLQPAGQSASLGANVTFRVTATGTTPITYQWRAGEMVIAGATSPTFTITNVALSDAGPYSVVVTHLTGLVASSPAILDVDPSFTKITNGPVVTNSATGWSAAWGDYDNDGDSDLFIAQGGGTTLANDVLYRNNGDGTLTKVTKDVVGPVVDDNQPGAGCAWVDYDNDGYLDLYVANPGLTTSGIEKGRKSLLYHNDGAGQFTQVTTGSPANDIAASSSGIWGDYDNDGFMDLFVANGGHAGRQSDFLYRNNGNTNAWLKLKLNGTVSNRSAIGAKIRVRATIKGKNVWQMREISGGDGLFSQNDMRPNFGLGDAASAETVRIEWPSGIVQEFHKVTANQFLTVTEPPKLTYLVKTNGFGELRVTSWKGFVCELEVSNDLRSWTSAASLTNKTGTLSYADSEVSGLTQRFYRVVSR